MTGKDSILRRFTAEGTAYSIREHRNAMTGLFLAAWNEDLNFSVATRGLAEGSEPFWVAGHAAGDPLKRKSIADELDRAAAHLRGGSQGARTT